MNPFVILISVYMQEKVIKNSYQHIYGDTCGFIFSQGKNFNILYCEEQLKLWNII